MWQLGEVSGGQGSVRRARVGEAWEGAALARNPWVSHAHPAGLPHNGGSHDALSHLLPCGRNWRWRVNVFTSCGNVARDFEPCNLLLTFQICLSGITSFALVAVWRLRQDIPDGQRINSRWRPPSDTEADRAGHRSHGTCCSFRFLLFPVRSIYVFAFCFALACLLDFPNSPRTSQATAIAVRVFLWPREDARPGSTCIQQG